MPFVKGVVPFLKGDRQLVKGADSLKLLSKLAVFPLLLIFAKFDQIFRDFSKMQHFSEITNYPPPYPPPILPLSPPLFGTAAVSPDFGTGQYAAF